MRRESAGAPAGRRASAVPAAVPDELYRQIIDSASTGIWTLDAIDRTTVVNPAMAELLSYTPEQMHGRALWEFVEPFSIPSARRDLAACREGTGVRLEIALRRAGGETVWMVAAAEPIHDASGQRTGTVAMLTELGALRELQDEMRALVDRDPLTRLFNRQWLVAEVDRRLEHAARSGRGGAVLLLDIDNFATISELYGYGATDELIRGLGAIVAEPLRDDEHAARAGSDDFAIVLGGATWREALTVAKYVRSQLRVRFTEPAVTASIGIALFDGREALAAEDLLLRCEIARRAARDHGGDQAQLYARQSNAVSAALARVREGVAQERFVLFGEPIVDLRTGAVVREELLIRMLSENGELVSPETFLPTAERFGMITAVDRWTTRAALEIAGRGTRVSVNLSARSVGDEEIVALVRDAIARGLDPSAVVFEITETAALTDLDGAREFAERLAGLGAGLALDDFGAGFASLHYLKHVPADYLKIDRGFIRDLRSGATDQELVKGIVGIARGLGKRTIAEGVPDRETLALLRGYGVDLAQGGCLGAPRRLSPLTEFERSLPTSARSVPANGRTREQAALEPSGPILAAGLLPSAAAEPELRGPRVLVAEDNEVNQLAVLRMLEKIGCQVDLVEDGRRAIELSAETWYGAILIDCELPVLDGYAAVTTIRRRESGLRHTPIIAMTANSDADVRQRYLAAGVDAYMVKPVRWATLNETLSGLLGEREHPEAGTPRSAASGPQADRGIVDPDVLREVADHEPALVGDIVSLFCEESRRQIARLAESVAAGDPRGAYAVASRLKGGATDVGARRMLAVCERIGEVASNGDLEPLAALQSDLEQAFSQTETALLAR